MQETINGKLNDGATVFQAESTAISRALALVENVDDPVTILTDSQALIKALACYKDDSRTIQNTRTLLNEAAENKPITLRWIKAHVNNYGNELADLLAKDGAQGHRF